MKKKYFLAFIKQKTASILSSEINCPNFAIFTNS